MTTTDKSNVDGDTGAMTKDSHAQVGHEQRQWSTKDVKREVSWPSVLFYIHLNILGFYGIIVLFTHTSLLTVGFCKYLRSNWMIFRPVYFD